MSFLEKLFLAQPKKPENEPKYKTIRVMIDEETINSSETQQIIEPVWQKVSIYDGEEKYEADLAPFTLAQRYVFAVQWYMAEVTNGGHDQFYFNSTGIVWEDALKGFEAINARENVEIIKASIARMGGSPSKNRAERQRQLEELHAEFDDLDTMCWQAGDDLANLLTAYIKENAKEFLFSGDITYRVR